MATVRTNARGAVAACHPFDAGLRTLNQWPRRRTQVARMSHQRVSYPPLRSAAQSQCKQTLTSHGDAVTWLSSVQGDRYSVPGSFTRSTHLRRALRECEGPAATPPCPRRCIGHDLLDYRTRHESIPLPNDNEVGE